MTEIIAYKMKFYRRIAQKSDIELEPFKEEYYKEYQKVYNHCFHDMRKSLEIEPYDFYSSIEQLEDKKDKIYVLWQDNTVVASVCCNGNEIDDLIVSKSYQNKGLGKKTLIWAIEHIRKDNDRPITLNVAKWNEKAMKLYLNNGFDVSKIEKVR